MPIDDAKQFLRSALQDPALREVLTTQLAELFDDEMKELIEVYGHNTFVGIVHAIRGPQVTREARDYLMTKLSPDEQVAIMQADLATLQRQNLAQDRLKAKLGVLGETLGRVLITVGKMYLPIPR